MTSVKLEASIVLSILLIIFAERSYKHSKVSGHVYLNLVQPLEVEDIELKIWGRERTFMRQLKPTEDTKKAKRKENRPASFLHAFII